MTTVVFRAGCAEGLQLYFKRPGSLVCAISNQALYETKHTADLITRERVDKFARFFERHSQRTVVLTGLRVIAKNESQHENEHAGAVFFQEIVITCRTRDLEARTQKSPCAAKTSSCLSQILAWMAIRLSSPLQTAAMTAHHAQNLQRVFMSRQLHQDRQEDPSQARDSATSLNVCDKVYRFMTAAASPWFRWLARGPPLSRQRLWQHFSAQSDSTMFCQC